MNTLKYRKEENNMKSLKLFFIIEVMFFAFAIFNINHVYAEDLLIFDQEVQTKESPIFDKSLQSNEMKDVKLKNIKAKDIQANDIQLKDIQVNDVEVKDTKDIQLSSKKIAIGLKFDKTSVKELKFKSNGLSISNDASTKVISTDKIFTAKPLQFVYVDENSDTESSSDFMFAESVDKFKNASLDNKYATQIKDAVGIYDSKNNLIITIPAKSDIYFISNDLSPIEVFDKKYRGGLKFINNNSMLTVINYLYVEDYLLGVVSKEMVSSWNLEALKAQAIAARSFAYSNYNKFSKYGFNLTDDTRSQAYGGFSAETDNTTKAVNETKGIVGYYEGKIAELIYNASSGGKTESSQNIWLSKIPYLIAQDDPYSIGNPYDNWSFSVTSSEIENIFKKRGKDIGKLQNITIDDITSQGYVIKMTFNGSLLSQTLKKDEIRGLFGSSKLKSLKFAMTNSSGTYNFSGSGYGHGIGMSQYGAKSMADKGYNYTQILEFYYPGVKLEQIK
jgi:sporulation protein spoIID